jgi:hypothetical protein
VQIDTFRNDMRRHGAPRSDAILFPPVPTRVPTQGPRFARAAVLASTGTATRRRLRLDRPLRRRSRAIAPKIDATFGRVGLPTRQLFDPIPLGAQLASGRGTKLGPLP